MARTHLVPMLLALGFGACALENPEVRIGPPATTDAALDLDVGADVGEMLDIPIAPSDIGLDGGVLDTGVVDTGVVDAGAIDTGAIDTGAIDTGAIDTGAIDTGAIDTGAIDTGAIDAGADDTGAIDTGAIDTGAIDTGAIDTGPADTGVPDVVVPRDSGATDVPVTPTCGAQNQDCCAGSPNCQTRLSCQERLFQSSTCRPCGGYLQACCGGVCAVGPCRLLGCIGI